MNRDIIKYPVTVFILYGLLAMTGYDRLVTYDLWAEDGTHFLGQYLQEGVSSISNPLAGYYHLLPRLITIIGFHLSITYYPLIISLFCMLITACIFALPVLDRYEYLFGNLWYRLTLCLTLCFLPGLNEILGNLANLHWILFLGIALVSLGDTGRSLTSGDLILVTLGVFSESVTMILLPLFAIRLLWRYGSTPRKGIAVEVYCLTIIVFGSWLNSQVISTTSVPVHPDPVTAINVYTSSLWKLQILQPIFSEVSRSAFQLPNFTGYIIWIGILGLTLYFLLRKHIQGIYIGILLLLIPLFLTMISVFRYSIFFEGNVFPNEMWNWQFRYAFITSSGGELVFFALLALMKEGQIKVLVLLASILFSLQFESYRFLKSSYGSQHRWPEHYQAVRNYYEGTVDTLSVPIYPDGWMIKAKR
jgi:hypothetical protein